MAFYVNSSQLSSITIGGVDVTDRVVEWTASDSPLFNNGMMVTSGNLTLARKDTTAGVIDYGREKYSRGTEVIVDVSLTDGSVVRHPRGLLYVISTAYSPEGAQLLVELGCRLTLASLLDDPSTLSPFAPIHLDPAQDDIQSVSASLAAAGEYLYQDNQGDLVTGSFFEDLGYGVVPSQAWTSVLGLTATSASALQSSGAIPDTIALSYKYPSDVIASDQTGRIETTETISEFFMKYPGIVYTRLGSGLPTEIESEAPPNTSDNSCNNNVTSPNDGYVQPGTCGDNYTTVPGTITIPVSTRETSESHYNGPAGQISYSISETFGPGIQVNGGYYADLYAACRYTYGTTCNPGGGCPTDGGENILQNYKETFYTYDSEGTLIRKVDDSYENLLSAAQDVDWRSGVVNGIPQDFQALPVNETYLAQRQVTEYYKEESANIEEVTTYTSIAEDGSGIGQRTTDFVQGATTSLETPTTFPRISGSFQNLSTQTNGLGTGLVVDVTIGGAGVVSATNPITVTPDGVIDRAIAVELLSIDTNNWPAGFANRRIEVSGPGEDLYIDVDFNHSNQTVTFNSIEKSAPSGSGVWSNGWTVGDIFTYAGLVTSSGVGDLPGFTGRVTQVSAFDSFCDTFGAAECSRTRNGEALYGGTGSGATVTYSYQYNGPGPYDHTFTASMENGGRDYTVGDVLRTRETYNRVSTTTRLHFQLTAVVTAVDDSGAAVSVEIVEPGENYSAGDAVYVTTDSFVQAGADPTAIAGQPNLFTEVASAPAPDIGDASPGAAAVVVKNTVNLKSGIYRDVVIDTVSGVGYGAVADIYVPSSSGTITELSIQQYPIFTSEDKIYRSDGTSTTAYAGSAMGPTGFADFGYEPTPLAISPTTGNPLYSYHDYTNGTPVDPQSTAASRCRTLFGYNQPGTCGDNSCIQPTGMYVKVPQVETSNIELYSGWSVGDEIRFTAEDLEAQDPNPNLINRGSYGWRSRGQWCGVVDPNGPDLICRVEAVTSPAPEIVIKLAGYDYQVGDLLEISTNSLAAAGATNANSGTVLRLEVTAIGGGQQQQNSTLNAMGGSVKFKRTRSMTISSLPVLPPSVNSPTTDTEEDVTIVDIRNSRFLPAPPENQAYQEEAQVPVPLLYETPGEVQAAVQKYSDYLRTFTIGDALGIQVSETLSDDIAQNWHPGAAFRFVDSHEDKIFAMRADACVWGLTPEAAAVSINGIFLGETDGLLVVPEGTNGATTPTPISGGGAQAVDVLTAPTNSVALPYVSGETFLNSGDTSMIINVFTRAIHPVTQDSVGLVGSAPSPLTINAPSVVLIYCAGQIVETGSTLETVGAGGVPYSYNGSLLTDAAVVIDADIMAASTASDSDDILT